MTTKSINEFRKLRAGTLQIHLADQANQLTDETGSTLVMNAHNLGDHAAGLATILQSAGLVSDVDKAVPVFGPTTSAVRRGGLVYDAQTGITTLPSGGIDKPKN